MEEKKRRWEWEEREKKIVIEEMGEEKKRSWKSERSEKESSRRKINVKTTITMKTDRIGVRADLVWQSTTTWHSPVTGVSW